MVHESEIHGIVRDHNSNGVEDVFVEAYHCPNFAIIPPLIGSVHSLPPYCFLGKSKKTDENGKFNITFPSDAYGLFGNLLVPWPNIELWIVDKYRKLYTNPLKIIVTPLRNNFVVEIPAPKFTYSNQIDHVDWEELIVNFIDGVNKPKDHPDHRTPEELKETLTALLIPIYDLKYTTQKEQQRLKYRGDIISYMAQIPVNDKSIDITTPKKQSHSEEIPSDWGE